ncbi:protein TUNAR-like [Heterodontus francisci]|uniref:protein TUNAR-like n=1 Tax=Heterodontus francisci TaxID=7792 RepID=UPI00355B7950
MVIIEHIEETRIVQLAEVEDEDKEERILAMLGISGTVLNLLVIIFVYIYTTL